jgi:hypothetical protein
MYGYSVYRFGHLPDWLLLLLREHTFIDTVYRNCDSIATYRFQKSLFAFLSSPVRSAI